MKNKSIAIFYSGGKYFGGIEKYLLNLFKYLPKATNICLISMGDWELTKKIDKLGFEVIVIDGKRFNIALPKKLALILKKKNISTIVTNGFISTIYGRLSGAKASIPVITILHSDINYDYVGCKKIIFKLIDRLTIKKTSYFIAVSKYLKETIVKKGVSPKQVEVVYNGVEDFEVPSKKLSKNITIGSIGRLDKVKGFDLLINSMVNTPGNVVLKIWGDGKEKNNLKHLVTSLGLENRVFFGGFQPEISKIFKQIDIYVQPSRSEGFGLTVVEAMLAGKPVVVTPAGGLPEIIVDGQVGIITDEVSANSITQKINYLLTRETLAKKLGQEARFYAKRTFSIDSWIENTQKIYLKAFK